MERYSKRSIVGGLGAGLLAAAAAGPARAGGEDDRSRPVAAWIDRHAVPLASTDPGDPLEDLAPLRRSIGDAVVVGLGEATHGAAQKTTLKHRALRLLVEQMGFRSIAWEDDWTLGLQIDAYIATGAGDLAALMKQMSTAWRSSEVAGVLRWLRDFNAGRADKVSFVGVEYFSTRSLAYDAVDAYVAGNAPERLAELRRHQQVIRPDTSDMGQYVRWYFNDVADKASYIDHARQVYALVDGLPHRPGDRAHALALHHARQIVSFYEHFSLPDNYAYRDARAAENLRWWHEYSGDKVAYWAASAHTANAPQLRIAAPPLADLRFPSAGSYLRRWYGERYRSIGFTCDHGAVRLGFGGTVDLPPPAPDWFEHPLGEVGADQFVLDLRAPAPPPVRRWLEAPLRTRGIPEGGPASYMAGGSLAQWFDAIVHRQELTPVQPA